MKKEQQQKEKDEATFSVDPRLDLSVDTTSLALDRTQLAWVRTVMAMITTGIALDKGSEVLHAARLSTGAAWSKNGHFGGLLLTIAATALMVLVTIIYVWRMKQLVRMRSTKEKLPSPTIILSIFQCLVGGLAIYFLDMPW